MSSSFGDCADRRRRDGGCTRISQSRGEPPTASRIIDRHAGSSIGSRERVEE
jgi:hypothetical protein